MCKVLTQSKDRLLDVSNTDIYIEQKDKHIFNICIYRFNRSVVLGTYRTEEYAKLLLHVLGTKLVSIITKCQKLMIYHKQTFRKVLIFDLTLIIERYRRFFGKNDKILIPIKTSL